MLEWSPETGYGNDMIQSLRWCTSSHSSRLYYIIDINSLESGAAYFVVSVLLAIFDSDSSGITFNVLESIAIHIVVSITLSSICSLQPTQCFCFLQNIAATLIIVRVGLGQNIQDTGKTHPAEEARNTRLQPRAEFSAHQTRSPIPPVLDIKASEDSLTA